MLIDLDKNYRSHGNTTLPSRQGDESRLELLEGGIMKQFDEFKLEKCSFRH